VRGPGVGWGDQAMRINAVTHVVTALAIVAATALDQAARKRSVHVTVAEVACKP